MNLRSSSAISHSPRSFLRWGRTLPRVASILLATGCSTALMLGGTIRPAWATDVTFDFKVIADGTATFTSDDNPGNDSGDQNGRVRTLDVVTYAWRYAVNNGNARQVVLQATIPSEQEFTGLPPVCKTGSEITLNAATGEQNVVCNLGRVTSGSAGQIEIKTRILGQRRAPLSTPVGNGQTTGATGSFEAENVTRIDSTPPDLTISARPKADLFKDGAWVQGVATHPTDGRGLIIRYPIQIAVTGGGKGSEPLVGPINITDALLDRNTGNPVPGMRLYNWATNGQRGCDWLGGSRAAYFGSRPFGKIGGNPTGANGASGSNPTFGVPERSVSDSGTWTCTQAGPGQPVQISITGADTTGNHAPEKSYNNRGLPADRTYLVSGILHLWVPLTDIANAGGQMDVRNQLSLLNNINGASGQPNEDPPNNNLRDHTLVSVNGSFTSYYANGVDSRGTPMPGMSAIRGGDGPVMPGQVYTTRVFLSNNGALNWEGATLCNAIDNKTQQVTPLATTPDKAVQDFSTADNAAYVIEYGTGGYADYEAQRTATCRDTDSPGGWHSDIRDVPGGPDAVTKIRVKMLPNQVIPPTKRWDIAVNLTARNNYLGTTTKIPVGTRLTETSSFTIQDYPFSDGPGMPAGWRGGYYNPETHRSVGWGDRLALTRAIVRLDKQNVPDVEVKSIVAGDRTTFVLRPTVTATIDPAPVSPEVIVKDILPATLNYVPGSATLVPTSVVNNADGTTTITWNLGRLTPNDPIPEIRFDADVRLDAPNNSTAVNTAIIESEDDGSLESARTDTVSLSIGNAAAFQIFKEVDKVLVEQNEQVVYKLFYANTGSSDVGASQFIDVLPHGGDGRVPETTFAGSWRLSSVSGTNGETFEYTLRPHGQINADPDDVSNQAGGATQWCTEAQVNAATLGCPTNLALATGIRINAPAFPRNTPTRVVRVVMDANTNEPGNTYTNNFSGRASGLLGLLQSNDVFSQVRIPSNVALVKRITAINGQPLEQVIDDPSTTNDNDPNWPTDYLRGVLDGGFVKPGDEVEYTIYYLSNGGTNVSSMNFCDLVPEFSSYVPGAYNGGAATPGSERGIAFEKNQVTQFLTNVPDGDVGQYFAPGVSTSVQCRAANTNGAVVVNVGQLSHVGYGGTKSAAYGLVRFRTIVK